MEPLQMVRIDRCSISGANEFQKKFLNFFTVRRFTAYHAYDVAFF
jgi:hypothetical protein